MLKLEQYVAETGVGGSAGRRLLTGYRTAFSSRMLERTTSVQRLGPRSAPSGFFRGLDQRKQSWFLTECPRPLSSTATHSECAH